MASHRSAAAKDVNSSTSQRGLGGSSSSYSSSGASIQAFQSSRLPVSGGNSHLGVTSRPSAHNRGAIHGQSSRREDNYLSPSIAQKIFEMCGQILEEQKKIKEDFRRASISIGKFGEELRRLSETVERNSEDHFTVENSIYKVRNNLWNATQLYNYKWCISY